LLPCLLHGGGPDHHSLLPLAHKLADLTQVIVPDIRGYGVSVCTDPLCHTWKQYAEDVLSLLDYLKADKAVVGGTGLGATISLRFALEFPHRTEAIIPISIEEIEDDEAKKAEIEFMDAFAERVRKQGIMSGWEPILDDLAPVIRALVEDAIPAPIPQV
jgi:3-oxoadipate enol-lactonase